jgi:hypothetical protein
MNSLQEKAANLLKYLRKRREELEALDLDALVKSGQLISLGRGWYETPGKDLNLPVGVDYLAIELHQEQDGRVKVKLADREQMLKVLREI